MNSLNNQKQELAKYTKEDLINAILKHDFRGHISGELPLIKYSRMTIEASKMASKASEYMKNNNFRLGSEWFDKSNSLYEEANDFLNRNRND